MIERIELTNFMSHSRTVIEPAEGLTVLVGPNNCGKSAFVTALQILCHNADSNYVLRHGESKCSVVVETSEGHRIEWTRKKRGAASYLIDGQVYDRLNRSVPDQLHEILKMPKVECGSETFDVHFGEQSEPVFLLRSKGRASAQFFASSSDATHLVAMQELHKNKVRDANRDLKRETQRQDELHGQLDQLKPVQQLEQQLVECERQFQQIRDAEVEIEQLSILISALKEARHKSGLAIARCHCLQQVESPPALPDPQPLEQHILSFKRQQTVLARATALFQQLDKLPDPPELESPQPLAELIRQWKLWSDRDQFLQRMLTHLGPIAPPPVLQDVATLQALFQRLKGQSIESQRLVNSAAALNQLPEPPVLNEDLSSLAGLIARLNSCHKQVADKQASVERTQVQLDELRSESQRWVEDHPICPTCGGPTSADHLLGEQGATS